MSATTACPRCGAPMAAGQDWCVECGAAATTKIVPAPGVGMPVAIVAAVLVLAGLGAAAAIQALRNDANDAATRPTATIAAPAKTSTTAKKGSVPGAAEAKRAAVAAWPASARGYTVVLLSTTDRAGARAFAEKLAKAGTDVGILRSGEHASLKAGLWVVYSGRFTSQAKAQKAADAAKSHGVPDAYVRYVSRARR